MSDQYPEIVIQALASIFIALLLVAFIVTIFLLYQKKKLVQEKAMEAMRTGFEKELLQTKLEIQEDVFKKISMEIHDNIGQTLLLANVNISIMQAMPLPSEAPELAKDTKQLLSKAIDDVSQLSRSLHSDRITELGAFNAIKTELYRLEQKGLFNIVIEDHLKEDTAPLSKETQLILFRMFQEILNNIIKHARAGQIIFRISETANGLEMSITDNGIGFEFTSSENKQSQYNGVGLRSLHSRVNLFKGKISIRSVLGEGTGITIFIPFTER